MQTLPDRPAFAAFFRMLEARLSVPAIGIFNARPDTCRLWAATEAMRAIWPPVENPDAPAAWQSLPAPLSQALAQGGARQIDPQAIGLVAGFAAVLPVATPIDTAHFLLIHDPRRRRLTPAMIAALDDAADLLSPWLSRRGWHSPRATAPGRPPSFADGLADVDGSAVRGAILPRVAANRIVETTLRAQTAHSRLALFMIDLDRFRSVNEALGTAAGDALLAVTGARLERALERTDRLVRLEGDRFVVLAASPPGDLGAFARRLLDIISQPLTLAGRTLSMQASIGIVTTTADEQSASALLLQADSAMRRAKAAGRNGFAVHEPRLDAANLDKSQLELDLSNAPLNGQMHLTYQPFVDLDTGAITGVEALMRWRHPTRGEVPPNSFIPLAEATGLILPLGTWALRTACREAARWPARLSLAVNISALQFHQPGFIAQVDAVLAESGFPADRLELEITETVLMRDNPETIAQLRALIDRGIRIALDDFGTGYSALAYLARLPHHRIKLDKSFVQDLVNPATADLIRAIIAQARANGVGITAEGVEHPDQLAQVRAMGFTHAQGYATGAPTPNPAALFADRVAI